MTAQFFYWLLLDFCVDQITHKQIQFNNLKRAILIYWSPFKIPNSVNQFVCQNLNNTQRLYKSDYNCLAHSLHLLTSDRNGTYYSQFGVDHCNRTNLPVSSKFLAHDPAFCVLKRHSIVLFSSQDTLFQTQVCRKQTSNHID